MSMKTRWYKVLVNYLTIIGIIVTLTQVGGCGGGGGGGNGSGGPGGPQYNFSGPWSGTTDQGAGLAFTVEPIASYDITGLAFTVEVNGPECNESSLAVTEHGIVEPIKDNESRVHLETGTYSMDLVFYFDYANQAHGTWSVDYHTDSCNFTGNGTFDAGKGQSKCADGDGDGYYNNCGQLDCRGNDADIHPGATEICDDKIDNDCNGLTDCDDPACVGAPACCPNPTDADGDGFVAEAGCGTAVDCNDNDPAIHPGATESCTNGKDDDCDGLIDCHDPDCAQAPTCSGCTDLDADGFFAGANCPQASDCNDNDPAIHPGATDICHNGIDDNCDGQIDEGCSNKILRVGGPGGYVTIQAAIDAAQHGDTVLVTNGTYSENILFRGSGEAITVVSENGAVSTIIQGDGTGSVVTFAEGNSSTLRGFTITNGATSANGGGVLCGSSSSPTIADCIITGNTAAVGGGGIHCASSSSPLITNSIIKNNTTTGANNKSNGGGIHASTSSRPTIANCIIKNNTSSWNGGGLAINTANKPTIVNCAFSSNTAAVNGGAIAFQDSAPTITNCTLCGNSASGNGGAIASKNHQPGTAITNSILWENPDTGKAGEIAVPSGPILDVTYSDVAGGYHGTGNINADPLFTGEGDYHLQAGSPCIDAGTGSGAPSTDIDGDARPVDGQGDGIDDYDIGADEYVP